MLDQTPIIVAFFAGLMSFISPCILQEAPVLLSKVVTQVGHKSINKLHERIICSIFFFIGFVVTLLVLSFILTFTIKTIAYDPVTWLSVMGLIVIIAFGTHLTGIIRIPLWSKKHGIYITDFGSKHLNALACGATSVVKWMPCVGVILGSILWLSIIMPEKNIEILVSYVLGFAMPLAFVEVFSHESSLFIKKYMTTLQILNIAFGIQLIIIAILIFIQSFSNIDIFGIIGSYI